MTKKNLGRDKIEIFTNLLLALIIDSLIGLVGVFSLYVSRDVLHKLTHYLVAFAAGSILGGAIIHMFPEALELTSFAPELTLLGFALFFLLEKYLHTHHCDCHAGEKPSTPYVIIVGDALHNFTDGLVLAIAFLVNIKIGWITLLAVAMHEIPQELGNFAILIHKGMSRGRAILWTFFSQLTCILGGVLGYLFSPEWLIGPALAFAAGGFIYIGASDLVPGLHHNKEFKNDTLNFILMLLGMVLIWLLRLFISH